MNSVSTNTPAILLAMKRYTENWVMLALVIFLLGFFFFPSSSKHNTFFYIGVCVPAVILFPVYFKQLKPSTWLLVSTLILLFYLCLTSFWSIHYSTAQSLKYIRYGFTLYCLFVAVTILQHNRPNSSETLFKAFVIVGFFQSIYGIFEHFTTDPTPLLSRYNDPIDSSMLAGFLLLSCTWLIIESQSWKKSVLYFLMLIPFVIIMLLAKARGPQLAFILTLPFLAFFQSHNIKKFIPYILTTLLAFGLLLMFSDLSTKIFSRGMVVQYRIEIWSMALNESFNYFWFGQGASRKALLIAANGAEFTHSHNIILSVFRMGGIVGVVLFCTNLVLCYFAGLKVINSTHKVWLLWLIFGILCLSTNGKYPLTRPSSTWFAYWIPIAFICATCTNSLKIKN